MIGLVATPFDGPPWLAALREHGPMLVLVGIVLLFSGTAAMAFFIFRPTQRRLQNLQRTAAAIGSGETSARAAEQGGDEVAALAQAFNQMAADLDARVRELRESDRARRQLLADVSHELMTPLTAMRGYLETLGMPQAVRDQADRDRYLQIVMDETLRLESIIGDLLELARLEGGGTKLELEDVPVEELFARAADRHGAALRDKDITLDTHIARGRGDRPRRRPPPRTGAAEPGRERRASHAARRPHFAVGGARARREGRAACGSRCATPVLASRRNTCR